MKVFYYISAILILFSCTKDELGPQCINCTEEDISTQYSDVIIINEGNFGSVNGSVSLYKPTENTILQNIFQQANSLPSLGDVVQSITKYNSKGYIVVNNSSKIEVVDINSFNSLATITGFNSPRNLLVINNAKGYVTDLYSNSIQVVDINNNTITSNIPLNGWTEDLLMHNDTVYVCDMTNDNLLLINPANDAFIDSVKLGRQPNSMVIDQNNKIWILCDGGFNESNPQLIKYNPGTRTIESTFVFSSVTESPSELKINGSKNELYFINSSIYKMNISATVLPASPLVSNTGNLFYGLGVDPITDEIYISDAIDFTQNSMIFRYSNSGQLIDNFNAGIISGGFLFLN